MTVEIFVVTILRKDVQHSVPVGNWGHPSPYLGQVSRRDGMDIVVHVGRSKFHTTHGTDPTVL